MISSPYRDLVWNLVSSGTAGLQEIQLRVFETEQAMFEMGTRPVLIAPIFLPIGTFSQANVNRPTGRGSRIPPYMLLDQGRLLWNSMPDDAKRLLQEARIDRPCRLKVTSNSAAIDDLPWEWLNDGASQPLALRPEIRLCRSVPVPLRIPPLSIEPPVRVLLVLTNPKDERLLEPVREIDAIQPRLNAPPYTLKILDEPTWEGLQEAMKQEPHVVHYIGHAGINRGEGNVILHDWENRTHWISGRELAEALPLTVRLLCLSTCFTAPNYQILGLTRLAHAPAQYRIPTTIANLYPVDGFSVQVFWSTFYSALADQRGDTNEAFHQAQTAVAALFGAEADWGSFSLVIRDQSGEVMRLRDSTQGLAKTDPVEIQAQFASRVANDLAGRLATFGDQVPDRIRQEFEEAASKAADLMNDVDARGAK